MSNSQALNLLQRMSQRHKIAALVKPGMGLNGADEMPAEMDRSGTERTIVAAVLPL